MSTCVTSLSRGIALAVVVMLVTGCSQGRHPRTGLPGGQSPVVAFDFEKAPVGRIPPGFTQAQTGGGEVPNWVIQADPKAASGKKVLAQLDKDQTKGRFPLCIYNFLESNNVDVSVKYKAISGQVDQAAGIVIRLQDKDNYYITRANAIEDNIRFYKVQDGKRTQLVTAKLQTTSNEWHTLRLKAVGNHFEVYHDGRKMLDAQDDTFPLAGKVGLWTKADSVTYFDDLRVTVLP